MKRKLADTPEVLAENLVYIAGKVTNKKLRTELLKGITIALFNLAIESSQNQNDTRVEMARRFLALKKASEEYIEMLQQMPKYSQIYNQASGLLLSRNQLGRRDPVQHLYDLSARIELQREVERLRTELANNAKPVVYVEGPTDEMILSDYK